MNKKALITGVTGQDGSYLAEFLLERALQNPFVVGHEFFWLLKSQLHVKHL